LKEDAQQWGEVYLPLYHHTYSGSFERATNIRGATYNLGPGGSIQQSVLNPTNIFWEVDTRAQGRKFRVVRFALPEYRAARL
jgi:hypothetical protein